MRLPPFCFDEAGCFLPSTLTTHGKEKQAMFSRKIFEKHKKARLWFWFSRVCVWWFFLGWIVFSMPLGSALRREKILW